MLDHGPIACHLRAERIGRGWRQGHRRQRHAACKRDRLGQKPGARGDGGSEGPDARPFRTGARRRGRQAGSNDMSDHARNTGPMRASPRCGAKIRSGGLCRSPAVRGKKHCRMHGGAPGSGAPRANQNARKHGLFTRDAIVERKRIQALLGDARKFLQAMK